MGCIATPYFVQLSYTRLSNFNSGTGMASKRSNKPNVSAFAAAVSKTKLRLKDLAELGYLVHAFQDLEGR